MAQKRSAFSELLELGVDRKYLQKRMDDFRSISALMFFLGAPFTVGLWEWDYFRDPVGASNTLGLRLLFFPVFLGIGLAYKRVRDYRQMSFIAVGGVLLTEIFLMEIFSRLDGGMAYGNGGFMFYCLVPMIGFLGLSLRYTIPYSLICAALPHLLAVLGFVSDFDHLHYGSLIWPAAMLTILGYIATTLNYRARYEFERALERASGTDPLTGVANRRTFMPALQQEALRQQRFGGSFSLISMDIDHFKSVNDTHGHPTGDKVICLLTNVCCKESRQTDTVARLGGEEFAILLPQTDVSLAMALAERIRARIERLTVASENNVEFRFTASFGVAEYRNRETTVDQFMASADRALYQAKNSGRNRVVAAGRIDLDA
jgi:diguanylate cyclase